MYEVTKEVYDAYMPGLKPNYRVQSNVLVRIFSQLEWGLRRYIKKQREVIMKEAIFEDKEELSFETRTLVSRTVIYKARKIDKEGITEYQSLIDGGEIRLIRIIKY